MVDDAVKDLDRLQYFLTGERWDSLWSQRRYAIDVLKKINMEKCKAISTPMVQLKIIHKTRNSSVRTVGVKKHCRWLWKGKQKIIREKRGDWTYARLCKLFLHVRVCAPGLAVPPGSSAPELAVPPGSSAHERNLESGDGLGRVGGRRWQMRPTCRWDEEEETLRAVFCPYDSTKLSIHLQWAQRCYRRTRWHT